MTGWLPEQSKTKSGRFRFQCASERMMRCVFIEREAKGTTRESSVSLAVDENECLWR